MRFAFVIWAAFLLTTFHFGEASAQPAKSRVKKTRTDPQGFDALLADTVRVPTAAALTSLFWYQDSKCRKHENNFDRLQCEGVQSARRNQVSSESYYLRVNGSGAGVLRKGTYDEKRQSASLALSGCLYCPDSGMGVIAGKKKPRLSGGKFAASEISGRYFSFTGSSAAARFRDKVLGRLVVELVSTVPTRAAFRVGKRKGYRAEVKGYRVFDPCTGTVLLSSTGEQKVTPEVDTCDGDTVPVFGRESVERKPKKLSNAAIAEALRPVVDEARRCYSIYQVRGRARLRLVVTGEGQIESFVHEGDFSGTPTGDCIDSVVRKVRFPATERPTTEVLYPIRLP